MLVVHGVRDARHGAGEERRVAHEAHVQGLVVAGQVGGSGKPLCHRHAAAHAQAGVRGVKRVVASQRVAADVARIHGTPAANGLADSQEGRAMGAPGAQHGRTRRQEFCRRLGQRAIGVRRRQHIRDAQELRKHGKQAVHPILAGHGRGAVQPAVDVRRTREHGGVGRNGPRELQELTLQHGLELLHHQDVRESRQKALAQLARKRERCAHLEQAVRGQRAAGCVRQPFKARQGLSHVAARVSPTGNAQVELPVGVSTLFEVVERAHRKLLGDARQILRHARVRPARERGEDHEARVLRKARDGVVRDGRQGLGRGDVYAGAAVVHTRGGAQNDGATVSLGEFEGRERHGVSLLGRGRVEHRNVRELRELAGVLLRLARDGARVVRHDDDEAAHATDVRQAHEWVARHVHAHLLARHDDARARVAGAGGELQGHLLVRGPLNVHGVGRIGAPGVQPGDGLHDLRRRGARIAAGHVHARGERGNADGLVARKKSPLRRRPLVFVRHVRMLLSSSPRRAKVRGDA